MRALVDNGSLGPGDVRALDALRHALPSHFDDTEPPSRLHGDLWGGNVGVDERATPIVFDPAAYGGHRELDVGMMKLFGGFSERTFDAYQAAWPLPPGHEQRVRVCQLYPLLVHARLFGGSYVGAVRSTLAAPFATV